MTQLPTFVLVASRGDDDRDPEWLKNLLAHLGPEANWRGANDAMRARVANDDEATTTLGKGSRRRRSSATEGTTLRYEDLLTPLAP